jgi:hypothetical protein
MRTYRMRIYRMPSMVRRSLAALSPGVSWGW